MKNSPIVFFIAIILAVIPANVSAELKTAITYNKLGWEYLEKGDSFKALIQFKNALQQNPNFIEAKTGLACAFLDRGGYSDSLDLFNQVLKVEPKNQRAIVGVAESLKGLGKYDGALEKYSEAISNKEDDLDSHYGIAEIYYLMNRKLWAERKIDYIYRMNPYHYKTLLLDARIKGDAGRIDDAEDIVKKAISSNPDIPEAYNVYGRILLKKFLISGDNDILEYSRTEFERAVSINPNFPDTYQNLALINLITTNNGAAVENYKSALSASGDDPLTYFNMAYAYTIKPDNDSALENYEKSYKLNSDDFMVMDSLENFLVNNDFPLGHPLRVSFSRYHYDKGLEMERKNLSDYALYHFRKSSELNPMFKEPREKLLSYYELYDFNNFYVNELKTIQKLYPSSENQNRLSVSVVKRRDRLYSREGYNVEEPERDVPSVLILDPESVGGFPLHNGAGTTLADAISFSAKQFGRMKVIDISERKSIMKNIKKGWLYKNDTILENLSEEYGNKNRIDYVVFGNFYDGSSNIEVELKLMDFKTGVVISQNVFRETGKDYVSRLSYLAGKYIYEKIPFKGRVLKYNTDNIIVNLGKLDGIKKDDLLYAYSDEDAGVKGKFRIKKKIVFKVAEEDTLIVKAVPLNEKEIEKIRADIPVFPLKKVRAKMIE